MIKLMSIMDVVRLNLGSTGDFDAESWSDGVLLSMLQDVITSIEYETKVHVKHVHAPLVEGGTRVDLSDRGVFIKTVTIDGIEIPLVTRDHKSQAVDRRTFDYLNVSQSLEGVKAMMDNESPCIFTITSNSSNYGYQTTYTNTALGVVTDIKSITVYAEDIINPEGEVTATEECYPNAVVSYVPSFSNDMDIHKTDRFGREAPMSEWTIDVPHIFKNAIIYGMTRNGMLLFTQEIALQAAHSWESLYSREITRIITTGASHHSAVSRQVTPGSIV